MKIAVLLKEVPIISDIRIDKKTFTVDRSQAGQMMNPSDVHAITAAVALAKQKGDSTVTAISMGTESCESILRDAVAMGATNAVRITDDAFSGADTLVTTRVLKEAIDTLGGFDCIFCGDKSVDGATGQIASKLGTLLGMAVLTSASKIEITETGMTIHRKLGTGLEQVTADFPIICSVTEDANEAAGITIKGRMAAKKAEIVLITNETLQLADELLTSPSKIIALFPPAAPKQGLIIKESSVERSAEKLVKTLLENRYV